MAPLLRPALQAGGLVLAIAMAGAPVSVDEAAAAPPAPSLDLLPTCLQAGQAFAMSPGFVADGLDVVGVSWALGDGEVVEGHLIHHAYRRPGLYRVTVTVAGADGTTAAASRRIWVAPAGGEAARDCWLTRIDAVRVVRPVDPLGVTEVKGTVRDRLGDPVAGAPVALRWAEGGAALAAARSSGDGGFRLRARIGPGGRFRLAVVEAGGGERSLRIVAKPSVRLSERRLSAGLGRPLTVRGVLRPALPGKLVQLEWKGPGGWRPLVQTRAREGGRFTLSYRFARAGRYRVPMRVVAPRDLGWDYGRALSPAFVVAVGGA